MLKILKSNKIFLGMAVSLIALLTWSFSHTFENVEKTKKSLYDIQITSIEDEAIDLNEFKGKKIMFVNVASKCGYTPQYSKLQKLHDMYKDQLVIIGVPCNQFMGQEPGTNEEIVSFCQKNYGVSFLMTEKVDVKGSSQHPLYQWLTSKDLNGNSDSKVKWNFQKYLVSETGELIDVFSPGVDPLDEQIISKIAG
ncbi:MAG: glutathione peroxidase [Crocinitomicaceae bacterium]|nr:glutathione peroxidase [Crocinitomicaceae bacterium]